MNNTDWTNGGNWKELDDGAKAWMVMQFNSLVESYDWNVKRTPHEYAEYVTTEWDNNRNSKQQWVNVSEQYHKTLLDVMDEWLSNWWTDQYLVNGG